jgi:hypothetical protein
LVAFKSFKSLGVLVHFDHVKNRDQEVPIGFERIKNSAGVNLPFALVTTADGKKGVHAISAAAIHEDPRKAERDAKRKLAEIDVVGDLSDLGKEEKAGDGDEQSEKPEKPKVNFGEWTNSEGKTMKAMPVEINDDTVKFRLESEKTFAYAISKLSEESQLKLEEYFKSLE